MRKAIVGVMCVLAVGIATAQMVTYLDNQGKPFMYSSKVGNQTTYTDANGKPVAYMFSPSSGPRVDPINTPSLLFPMVSPSFPGAVSPSVSPLPALTPVPQLPTLRGL